MPMQREDEVRYLIRVFEDNWQAVEGYTPGNNLIIHSGEPDDTSQDPQIVIDNINETPRGGTGYTGMRGNGKGFYRRVDGRADVRCISGTDDDVDVHPRYLARQFSGEIQRILESNWAGMADVNTGDIEYRSLGPGTARGPQSDEEKPGRWYAIQEAMYVYTTPS